MGEANERVTRLEPGSLFAGYRIEGLIDRGGMGVVYKASDMDLDRTVALKIIAPEHTQDPDAVARFKVEARLAASLEHPNIVPIHRGGEFEGVLYLAMRFVPGINLRQRVDRGQLDMDEIRRVITSVASALDAAHERGLVHRDVKPGNILISGKGEDEQVYLTDFGLTKRLGSAGSLTRTGAWVGTPDYVAPEQIQAGKVDGRTDVYSLGCVLYEMLTGSVAFPRDNDMAKLWAHVTDPPPPPSLRRPDLVKDFDEIVARSTAKDPDDRYASASEFSAAVDRAITGQRSKAAPGALQETRLAGGLVAPPVAEHDVFLAEPAPPEPEPAAPARNEPQATAPPAGGAIPPPQGAVAPPPQPPAGGEPAGRPEPAGAGGSGGTGGARRPTRSRWPLAAALVLVAAAIAVGAVVLMGSGSSDDDSEQAVGERVPATLSPVPTNKVDGLGNATIRLDGTTATVALKTNGLVDGQPHAMHIHAGEKGACPTVEAARDHNGHLSISTLDGAAFYGHPRVALTTRGDIGVASILEFPRYPKVGNITYKRTVKLRPRTARFVRRNLAVIVIHGIDYNGNGAYDGTLGGSDLNPALSGEATAPALCGELLAGRAAQENAQRPDGPRVYSASLGLPPGTRNAIVPDLICHLGRTT